MIRALIRQAKEELTVGILDLPLEQIPERRGVIKGLNMVENFFRQAEAVLREAEEQRRAEEEAAADQPPPPGAVAALMSPAR